MSLIRIFTDEDVYGAIAPALRQCGFDAVSSPEADRLGATDEEQLEWAATEGRSIVTFNVAHFARLHGARLLDQKHHAGIIVSSQRSIGMTLQRLLNLARTVSAEDMRDRLEYLSHW